MAPVAQSDVDMDSHTSDMASHDSQLRRQFSEPLHAHSTSTHSPSPSPMTTPRAKCAWCGKFFESSDDDPYSQNEALEEHIAMMHPHIAKFSLYDGVADEEKEETYDVDEQHGDDTVLTAPASEADEAPEAEEDGLMEAGDDSGHEGGEAMEGFDNENDQNDIDGPEAEGDGEGHEGESDLALFNQLHEFSRQEDSVSLDKRIHNLWNLHEISKFSGGFEETSTNISGTWMKVFDDPKRVKKRDTSELLVRPEPYKSSKSSRGEFLEISPLENFLVQLRDPELRSSDELYAITENIANVLKVWQDEYLAIEKLCKHATRQNVKPTSDPRKLERPEVYEDKKEAMLYGYKHETKEDKVRNQNPFVQGGFKPTPAQFRKMTAKAGPNNPNPDGWPTIMKFGVEHVPKFQNPPREEFVGKATRKRKAAELEAANKANETDEALNGSPAPIEEEPFAKRRTRTRRAGELDTQPAGSPAPSRGSFRGRGRGRGRGAARGMSRAGSEAPQPVAPVAPARSFGRGHGREVAASAGPLQSRPATAQLAPIEPAPRGDSATATPVSTQAGVAQDELLDPAEKARREKIANSKNPKRTEAMLNHWARFNREGRTRNPKRSKAQIEADRAAEAARKAAEPPKTVGKKKKSDSPVFGGPTRADGLAPAPGIPGPGALAPGPPGPHPQLAPMPPARSMAPYAPIDPRAVASFPPAPHGPHGLQPPPPPQPYRTPYPELYFPYGAAAAGLPPPGHTRPA
ncbi:hypothetical protein BDV35DRAFT_36443 [Aspergillus flavus]|uniref:DNA, SC003 n=5 Tax=Aspergillus subgen. Circumdati TaxID=2720871 RepID=Q2UK29_ASPOR|nr:unnamed protein product [Aspergillus oryzae RIB40]EIT82664.1 hypothetical protein Ao3042_00143 [Aspergillus oryzae 3.042]KAB8250915.1 hypothetical protein BDV35DRAFT_36443 [Aspergillus flavus]KDE79256.1 hypothetical protein AO1008_05488 [Aspergillus oryzae 100-8]KJJ29848.1 hypothetical protein AFLA70_10g006691 [Aspergillus flavus AF70]OOO10019.1 hypothetical protein OAory_01058270 [Aspergillus oryzae]GMG42128.1 unnamed protein product [Aspergillus oryzae var. brunneus]|eukprot:EIT82664.1 hypothetical protein Ao3042_00143 [Aspergillus oryzae 3.042]